MSVGLVIGVAVFILFVVGIAYFCKRRRPGVIVANQQATSTGATTVVTSSTNGAPPSAYPMQQTNPYPMHPSNPYPMQPPNYSSMPVNASQGLPHAYPHASAYPPVYQATPTAYQGETVPVSSAPNAPLIDPSNQVKYPPTSMDGSLPPVSYAPNAMPPVSYAPNAMPPVVNDGHPQATNLGAQGAQLNQFPPNMPPPSYDQACGPP